MKRHNEQFFFFFFLFFFSVLLKRGKGGGGQFAFGTYDTHGMIFTDGIHPRGNEYNLVYNSFTKVGSGTDRFQLRVRLIILNRPYMCTCLN